MVYRTHRVSRSVTEALAPPIGVVYLAKARLEGLGGRAMVGACGKRVMVQEQNTELTTTLLLRTISFVLVTFVVLLLLLLFQYTILAVLYAQCNLHLQ